MKMRDRLVERRKYIRLKTPVSVTYTAPDTGVIHSLITKDISADGLRLEIKTRDIKEGSVLELKLELPEGNNPVHAKGKVIWMKQISLEDGAPCDIGIEFIEIEEDNKNTFLKFLCDLVYNLPKESENV
ncbi:MAG: PilZ domain-containing protein [Candidatus Omnitrophica bacterium]|nr:PilZ domain-containing protein [Candidatus Omnitrophota bacterium]